MDDEQIQRSAVEAGAWLMGIAAFGLILNITSAIVSAGYLGVFAFFDLAWLLFGAGAVFWQALARRTHWIVVLLVAGFSFVAAFVNASMLRDSA